MEHIAIMKKSWHLLPKILTGEKTIESRWYKTRSEAWGKVKAGDTIYFKDSGEPVNLKAGVVKVLEFENLTPQKVKKVLKRYGEKPNKLGFSPVLRKQKFSLSGRAGLRINRDDVSLEHFYQLVKNKKYCVLIFLKNPRKVKLFNIDKKGFGAPRAWLTVKDINHIKTSDCL